MSRRILAGPFADRRLDLAMRRTLAETLYDAYIGALVAWARAAEDEDQLLHAETLRARDRYHAALAEAPADAHVFDPSSSGERLRAALGRGS